MTRQLLHQNQLVEISPKGFDLLSYLIQKSGKLVTKDEIYQAIWGETFVEENNIHVHISAVRRILGEKRGESKFIKTVPGKGYIFIAPIKIIADKSLVGKRFMSDHTLPDNFTSIAVLPFTFDPPDTDFEYLTNGLTQNLIEQLSHIPGFKVTAFGAVKIYKNSSLSLLEIAFQLGVKKILQGTITKFQNGLEINVELINAADSTYIWGNIYRCSTKTLTSSSNKIVLKIAEFAKLWKT